MKRADFIGFLVGLSVSVAACGPSDSDFAEFDTYRSPNQKYSVVVETAPSNSFAFSPEVVRFYVAGDDLSERRLLATTRLANDGSNITNENISAEWVDPSTLRVCLSGAEQDDETIVIDVAATSFYVEPATCVD